MLSEEMRKEIDSLKKYKGLEENKFYCDQILRCVPKEFYKNQEFIKEAVKVQPLVLRFVDDELITREIAEIAIEKDPHTLNLTPFKNDEELGIKAVLKDSSVLETLRELRDNFKVVKAAVEKDGYCIQFASERLQDDKELVLLAYTKGRYVRTKGVSARLKKDTDVIKALLNNRIESFRYLPSEIKEKYGSGENFLKMNK